MRHNDQTLLVGMSEKICYRCQETTIVCYQFTKTVMDTQNKVLLKIKEKQEKNFEAIEEASIEESFLEKDSRFDDMFNFEVIQSCTQDPDDQKSRKPSLDSDFDQHFPSNHHVPQQTKSPKAPENRSILKSKPKKIKPMIVDENGRFICQICHGSYASRNILMHHFLKHTSSKEFSCFLCPRQFFLEKDLKVHLNQSHLNRKRFACNECDSDFTTSSALKKHSMIHSENVKTFPCNQCDVSFKSLASMTAHSRTHKGQKPFICSICEGEKSFTQKINLQRHMKSVHNENIYKCRWCNQSFEKQGELRKHFQECENFQKDRSEQKGKYFVIVEQENEEIEYDDQNENRDIEMNFEHET